MEACRLEDGVRVLGMGLCHRIVSLCKRCENNDPFHLKSLAFLPTLDSISLSY